MYRKNRHTYKHSHIQIYHRQCHLYLKQLLLKQTEDPLIVNTIARYIKNGICMAKWGGGGGGGGEEI